MCWARAVIGLQAAELEVPRPGDLPCQRHRFRPRRHAAAGHADIDLDQHRQSHARRRRSVRDGRDSAADRRHRRRPARCGPARPAGPAWRADDLVADHDVRHAAPGQHLRLRHLLHALADGAARHLLVRDHRRFVRLGVGAQADAGGVEQLGHAVEILPRTRRGRSAGPGYRPRPRRMPGCAGGGCTVQRLPMRRYSGIW